jgi:hypothetical protein
MKKVLFLQDSLLWKCLFFSVLVFYCAYYAPYGINETDGGFLTGLAWQVLQGKVLYQDIIYVRPPLPVWLRSIELWLLPGDWAVLVERWIFYTKVAAYSWMAAAVLTQKSLMWILATIGFVVSAHCYPAAAWHTVDGIFFAVMAVFLSEKGYSWWAGMALFAALICKQSFWPLGVLMPLYWYLLRPAASLPLKGKGEPAPYAASGRTALVLSGGGVAFAAVLFFFYLRHNELLANYFSMTQGAASSGQAIQHGILDYFRITPELSVPSLMLLGIIACFFVRKKDSAWLRWAWVAWLAAVAASFAAVVWWKQSHVGAFAQSRMLFWVATVLGLYQVWKGDRRLIMLLAISWCAAVSWGYNLPILFATPWIWAAMWCTQRVFEEKVPKWLNFVALLGLLLVFRVGYEFVYRDGRRSEMQYHLGAVFPSLSGIYTDQTSLELYREMAFLKEKYGANFKILPAFPQANFLTQTPSPLPLDWVVNRETNGNNQLIYNALTEKKPYIFIQKDFEQQMASDPELEIARHCMQKGRVVDTTRFFIVLKQE